MERALAAQNAGGLAEAEALYRKALTLDSRSFDALHMLGVVCLQQGRAEEACRLLIQALPLMPAHYPPFFLNLGLALAAVATARKLMPGMAGAQQAGSAHRRFLRRHHLPPLPAEPPRVSIVAPCFNHEAFVAEAIASVASQSYPDLELIVIDDGSKDGSVGAIAKALDGFPFPHRFLHRENRGAHATLNEGIEMASGLYIGILNTDDLYLPDRVALMVKALAASGARWGFSNLSYMDEQGRQISQGGHPRVDELMRLHDALYSHQTVSEGFVTDNPAISTGNLFFEKGIWRELGGFEDFRYNHDWAFCLSAILIDEPAYLDEPLYRYRLHGSNTIVENRPQARAEVEVILSRWHRQVADQSDIPNQVFAEARSNHRAADLVTMRRGAGHVLDPRRLLAAAEDLGFRAQGLD